jgi:DNA-binding MarR family transcriptional regulator
MTACVCTTVRKASRALLRHYEKAFAEAEISQTQFSILRQLERSAPTPLCELADALVMERTSLYRTIRPLIESGSISVDPGADKRTKVARLTAEGSRQIEKAEPVWRRTQQGVVDALGGETWDAMSTILLTIPGVIEAQLTESPDKSQEDRS